MTALWHSLLNSFSFGLGLVFHSTGQNFVYVHTTCSQRSLQSRTLPALGERPDGSRHLDRWYYKNWDIEKNGYGLLMCDWFLTLAKQNSQGESSRHDATECDSLRSDVTVHAKGKVFYISSPSLVFARNRAQDSQRHCGYRSDGCQGAQIRLPAANSPLLSLSKSMTYPTAQRSVVVRCSVCPGCITALPEGPLNNNESLRVCRELRRRVWSGSFRILFTQPFYFDICRLSRLVEEF